MCLVSKLSKFEVVFCQLQHYNFCYAYFFTRTFSNSSTSVLLLHEDSKSTITYSCNHYLWPSQKIPPPSLWYNQSTSCWQQNLPHRGQCNHDSTYSHVLHNNVSVNDGLHTWWWSHKIILQYNIIILTIVFQLPHSIQYSNMLYRFVA